MSRSIPLWRSDNTCYMVDKKEATVLLAAIKNQVMNAGLNRYVPFSTCGQMGRAPIFSGADAYICEMVNVVKEFGVYPLDFTAIDKKSNY